MDARITGFELPLSEPIGSPMSVETEQPKNIDQNRVEDAIESISQIDIECKTITIVPNAPWQKLDVYIETPEIDAEKLYYAKVIFAQELSRQLNEKCEVFFNQAAPQYNATQTSQETQQIIPGNDECDTVDIDMFNEYPPGYNEALQIDFAIKDVFRAMGIKAKKVLVTKERGGYSVLVSIDSNTEPETLPQATREIRNTVSTLLNEAEVEIHTLIKNDEKPKRSIEDAEDDFEKIDARFIERSITDNLADDYGIPVRKVNVVSYDNKFDVTVELKHLQNDSELFTTKLDIEDRFAPWLKEVEEVDFEIRFDKLSQ
jgi:hypothetical protein